MADHCDSRISHSTFQRPATSSGASNFRLPLRGGRVKDPKDTLPEEAAEENAKKVEKSSNAEEVVESKIKTSEHRAAVHQLMEKEVVRYQGELEILAVEMEGRRDGNQLLKRRCRNLPCRKSIPR